jgi:hypothetical protein
VRLLLVMQGRYTVSTTVGEVLLGNSCGSRSIGHIAFQIYHSLHRCMYF